VAAATEEVAFHRELSTTCIGSCGKL
jgi:integrase